MKNAKVIAMCNQKGGVAKTTSTFNLGVRLSQSGYKVLLVDNDPQGNLTTYMGFDKDALAITISDAYVAAYENRILDDVILHHAENVDLIPADISLAFVSEELIAVKERETHSLLKFILAQYINIYDYIIIDCLPALGYLMKNALVASNSVIIPTQPNYGDVLGLQQLVQTILSIQQGMNKSINIDGILFTRVPSRSNASMQVMQSIEDAFSGMIKVFNSRIPGSVKIAEAPITGESIFKHAPRTKAAKAYSAFCEEVIING